MIGKNILEAIKRGWELIPAPIFEHMIPKQLFLIAHIMTTVVFNTANHYLVIKRFSLRYLRSKIMTTTHSKTDKNK